jgi:hypothetical protein
LPHISDREAEELGKKYWLRSLVVYPCIIGVTGYLLYVVKLHIIFVWLLWLVIGINLEKLTGEPPLRCRACGRISREEANRRYKKICLVSMAVGLVSFFAGAILCAMGHTKVGTEMIRLPLLWTVGVCFVARPIVNRRRLPPPYPVLALLIGVLRRLSLAGVHHPEGIINADLEKESDPELCQYAIRLLERHDVWEGLPGSIPPLPPEELKERKRQLWLKLQGLHTQKQETMQALELGLGQGMTPEELRRYLRKLLEAEYYFVYTEPKTTATPSSSPHQA